MKSSIRKSTALVLTLILFLVSFSVTTLATGENLLSAKNPGFETEGTPEGVAESGRRSTVAYSGNYSLNLYGETTGDYHIKYQNVPVKAGAKYTLSFRMQNSKAEAIKFWAANNAFTLNGNKKNPSNVAYGSLPNMVFGEAHEGDDIHVWREVRFSFIPPTGINMMHIAINANAYDEFLLVDDITLVEEDMNNLLWNHNPGFDDGQFVVGSGFAPDVNGTITDTAAHSGTHSLSMPTGYFKIGWFPVKALTNYTLSFWMQNSKADAIKFYAGNNAFLLDGNKSGSSLPDMVFGEAHEGDDVNVWREVRVNFTTPAGINMMNIAMNGNAEDPALLIDDLSLVETGKDFGRMTNGDFEEPLIHQFYAFRPWNSNNASYGLHVGLAEDAETGNHYLKSLSSADGDLALEIWYPFSGLEGNRFKLSFSQRFTNNGRPTLRFYTGSKPYFGEFPRASLDYIWEDYTMYIHGAAPGAAGSLWFMSFDLDNISIDVDENSLGFYKDIVLYTENAAGRHFSDPFDGATCTTEKTVKANALSDITADASGLKTVNARAHVIPTADSTGAFQKTEVTLLTAVYKYDKDGNKCLVTVNIATDASSDGKVLDAVGTVQVPENTQDATYKVEAVAWNSVDGMKALFEKRVLEN